MFGQHPAGEEGNDGQGDDERSNVILYRADGEEVRNPVKLINLREQVNPEPVGVVTPPKP
jgi:hypothetical protein